MSIGSSAGLARKQYFWVQLALLLTAMAGLGLSHPVASSQVAAGFASATVRTAALVTVALAVVVRSTIVIVVGAFSDACRVFRSRHLLACSALFAAAAVVVGSLVVHGPFDRLLAHGRITGEDIADFGSVLAAFVFVLGTIVASAGAWDTFRDERNWYRSLRS